MVLVNEGGSTPAMILIDGGIPQIVEGNACPVLNFRVLGRNGNVLRISSYDVINKKLVGSTTHNIDSDDYTVSDTIPTPNISSDTILDVVVDVEDSNGNVLDKVEGFMYFMPDFDTYDIDTDAEVYIVTKTGLSFKKRYPKNSGSVTYTSVPVSKSGLSYTVIYQRLDNAGKLAMFDGINKLFEVQGKSALVNIKFSIDSLLAQSLANYIDDENVMKVVYKVPTLAPTVGAFKAIESVYEFRRFTPIAVSVSEDQSNVYFKVLTQVDLLTPIDIWSVLKIAGGILAIIGGGMLLVASWGASAPVSIALISGGIGAVSSGVYVLYDTLRQTPQDIINKANQEVESAKSNIEATYSDLKDYLDQLVSDGKITQEEEDYILNYVNQIKQRAYKAFDELKDTVNQAYKRGYDDAVRDMTKWLIASGLGGFIGGVLVKSK